MLKEKHLVPLNIPRARLNDYLINKNEFSCLQSRKAVQKAIKRGNISVNGEISSTGYYVKPGDIIEFKTDQNTRFKVFKLALDVQYEDEYLAVIDKPAGFDVNGNRFRTIENALSFNLNKSTLKDSLIKLVPVHRLDNPTRGLLLIAKTTSSIIKLSKLFEDRKIYKEYNAVVAGLTDKEGTIDEKIDGRYALTKYKLVSSAGSIRWGNLSHIKLEPLTGRKHQIRKHMALSGFPVLGDKIYQTENRLNGKGLFLFASKLSFKHPFTGEEICIKLDPPDKFYSIIERENKNFLKYGNPQ